MSEAALEHYFRRRVIGLGGIARKVMPTDAGAPDRLVLLPGGIMRLVELKTEIGKLRPIQFVWHEKSRHLGTPVAVLYGRDQVDDWLRRLVDACGPQVGRGTRANPSTVQPRSQADIDADRRALL
jgi:hypothetical protein